jgi:dTDP-4-amino-4,6-dideoxygalactose transaminase
MEKRAYIAFGRPSFTQREIDAAARVLRSGWIGMGPETLEFEVELARYVGVPHVVSVNSCTSALFLSLLVQGVGPGDEVICPSLTWCSTANAALYLGATPVFCDIDEGTLCADAASVAAKLTSRTKAVVVVHFGGRAADIEAIRRRLPSGVALVEDAAHALGSKYRGGACVGTSGDLTCFSFYPNKNLSTAEGGAIALFDERLAERLRSLRLNAMPSHAWQRFTNPRVTLNHGIEELGYKMNFTDLQAAIARVQLERQPEMARIRKEIAQAYCDLLHRVRPDINWQDGILDDSHARHLFVIRVDSGAGGPSRDEVLFALRERMVGASIHYPPLHAMPLYRKLRAASLPVTERVCKEILTLPMSATMTSDDVEYVVAQLSEALGARRGGK